MRSCCSTPRTVVAGARSATSAQALCRSTKRSSASATIHISWNCARPTVEPLQRINAKQECRSLETTVKLLNFRHIHAPTPVDPRHHHHIAEGEPVEHPKKLAPVEPAHPLPSRGRFFGCCAGRVELVELCVKRLAVGADAGITDDAFFEVSF